MEVKIAESWKQRLETEFEKPYFAQLTEFVRKEYQDQTIYPPANLIFNAFDKCSFEDTKVVVLGQDPYHGAGQANGLCFSVADGVRVPPSLVNIFKEIKEDIGRSAPKTGNLERWASQGVMLLNATLTVRAGQAGSHQNKGWETFTDAIVKLLADEKEHLVFMLWGAYAHKKGGMIDATKHLILKSPHPSPMATGFQGNKHFSQANAYLLAEGLQEIHW